MKKISERKKFLQGLSFRMNPGLLKKNKTKAFYAPKGGLCRTIKKKKKFEKKDKKFFKISIFVFVNV